jgi:hypothetical protein
MSNRKVIDLFGDSHQTKTEAPPSNSSIDESTRQFGHVSIVYDFDDIPDDKWFGKSDSTGRAKLNSNNVALLLKRRGLVVQYDHWYDSIHVSHTGYKIDGLVEDRNITSLLKEQCCAYFQATVRPIDFREAIDILARRNTINSRIAHLDSFLPHFDKDYDWVNTAPDTRLRSRGI